MLDAKASRSPAQARSRRPSDQRDVDARGPGHGRTGRWIWCGPRPPCRGPRVAWSGTAQLVAAVEGGDLVALGEGRVVEHGLDEVVDGALQAHHGLTDMNELGRAGADDVHAEDGLGLLVDEQLEHAALVAEQLAARGLAVVRDAGLVRD